MKVYVVTSGEYSDYRIDCMFSTEALAQEWIEKAKSRDPYQGYSIETYDVDAEKQAEVITVWTCGILLDTGEIKERGDKTELRVPFRGETVQFAVSVPAYNRRLVSRVESGVSAEHAEKLAVESRQAWLRERPA